MSAWLRRPATVSPYSHTIRGRAAQKVTVSWPRRLLPMQRKALGRGLSSLLREVDTTTSGLESVAVELIDPNPFQPRRDFAEDSLKELTDSIRSTGVVQPVLLRRSGERYQLIAGERRWRAARSAGLAEVPALIRDLGDRETLELALTENLLREDLNPM